MSKRLRVRLSDEEMAEIGCTARREGFTVEEWVRRALQKAIQRQSAGDPECKLRAIRRAAEFSFPTGDVAQMLSEIEL